MPAVSARGSRKRRMVNEINVVPYIDVMLVLLVIFMVTAPMISTGVVDVPSAGQSNAPPDTFAQVTVRENGPLSLRLHNPKLAGTGAGAGTDRGAATRTGAASGAEQEFARDDRRGLADAIRAMRDQRVDLPVLIAAEKSVRYEAVMDVMAELQRMGVTRIALSVRK